MLSTLSTCESQIENNCSYNISTTENEIFSNCLAAATEFRDFFKTCFEKENSSAGCECFNSINTTNYNNLKKCNSQEDFTKIRTQKNACVAGITYLLGTKILISYFSGDKM